MRMFDFLVRGKKVSIKTGSFSLSGEKSDTYSGWPLTKTTTARKPRWWTDEMVCDGCGGDGWDVNSGGGVFICPKCEGTGVVDGSARCTCGHKQKDHYLYFEHTCLHGVKRGQGYPYPCGCRNFTRAKKEDILPEGKEEGK